MNGSRSPRRHALVAGALAAALACAGAVVVAASPASARPYGDCESVQTYTITAGTKVWVATNLTSGRVRGPAKATIPEGRQFASQVTMPAWLRDPSARAVVKQEWLFPLYYRSETRLSAHSLSVPRGQTRRLQQYAPSLRFTVKKYAATNSATCARGRLLYTGTVTAPTDAFFNENAHRYALVG